MLWYYRSLTGALGDKEEKDDKKSDVPEEEDPEILEAKREAEEKRNEKYRKMEEEREIMRQGIRDKVKQFPLEIYDHFRLLCIYIGFYATHPFPYDSPCSRLLLLLLLLLLTAGCITTHCTK
jgi:Synaphin protein